MCGFERAHFVETLAEVRGDRGIARRETVVELRNLCRADYGGGDAGLRGHPVQRDLCRGFAQLLRDSDQAIDDAPVAVIELQEDRIHLALGFLEASVARAAASLL